MSDNYILLESIGFLNTIPQYQTLVKVFVGLWLVWTMVKHCRQRGSNSQPTNLEVERKLEQWNPEPLASEIDPNHPSLSPRIVTSKIGKNIIINGKNCLNIGSHNYLGFLDNKNIENKAISIIEKYGVGSCGPRGFFGTTDVHLELEECLAKFMNTEEAIVYSYGFSTVSSAIPAYSKRNDIIFADEKVNFSIQKGIDASRSTVKYFKHNDFNDFERLLIEQSNEDLKNPKKAMKIRRFLVVEGIYMNSGCICPLPEFVELCKNYKVRIFIDESISFGTIGATGRGITEHFGVPRNEIDMIIGSLEWAIGSIGGFCVGSSFIIEHQRLAGLGYCFSASLPPLLTAAATTSVNLMQSNPAMFDKLKDNCHKFHELLSNLKHFELSASPESPIKHLYLKNKLTRTQEYDILRKITDCCLDNHLAVVMPVYLDSEKYLPRHSLRICVSNIFEHNDINFSIDVLEKCSSQIIQVSKH